MSEGERVQSTSQAMADRLFLAGISRRLVELHGGAVALQSVKGEGTGA